ncbi:hypothetical protein E2C01_055967 [Portunus trituberculatus]|uniref:Uncharacterized protein n=1 Tax=Portunus trituberculatus TaxID=210409 RepID=A0A5B7GNX6_PORTR|nr:hypothetical protein [Portunus trituberculatus]
MKYKEHNPYITLVSQINEACPRIWIKRSKCGSCIGGVAVRRGSQIQNVSWPPVSRPWCLCRFHRHSTPKPSTPPAHSPLGYSQSCVSENLPGSQHAAEKEDNCGPGIGTTRSRHQHHRSAAPARWFLYYICLCGISI